MHIGLTGLIEINVQLGKWLFSLLIWWFLICYRPFIKAIACSCSVRCTKDLFLLTLCAASLPNNFWVSQNFAIHALFFALFWVRWGISHAIAFLPYLCVLYASSDLGSSHSWLCFEVSPIGRIFMFALFLTNSVSLFGHLPMDLSVKRYGWDVGKFFSVHYVFSKCVCLWGGRRVAQLNILMSMSSLLVKLKNWYQIIITI